MEFHFGDVGALGGGRAGVESSEQEPQTQALARLLEQKGGFALNLL